jgi:hypothetical protein
MRWRRERLPNRHDYRFACLMKAASQPPLRKWLFDSIAVYARDEASSQRAHELVLSSAGPGERLGMVMLENGERIAWVKFQAGAGNGKPCKGSDRTRSNGEPEK